MKPPGKVYLIDTNVILRYLLDDHSRFSPKARVFMEAISKKTKKAKIPAVVIVECIYVLEKFYQVPKKEIIDKLSSILNFKGIVNPDKSAILKSLFIYQDTNVDIVDCILAAFSTPDLVVVSFDKDFEKLNAFRETL